MQVKIVRMNSGEDLITEVVESLDSNKITFKRPAVIIMMQDGAIALMPWMPYAKIPETGVTIDMKQIALVLDPKQDIEKEYIRVVTNTPRVTTPESKKLVTPGNLKLTD